MRKEQSDIDNWSWAAILSPLFWLLKAGASVSQIAIKKGRKVVFLIVHNMK